MRRVEEEAYTQPTVAGPLFDASPFDHSPLGGPSRPIEEIVAKLIWKHQGRHDPISITHIRKNCHLSERAVKSLVFDLRTEHHMPIGAIRGSGESQEETAGYFWIVDAADREIATAPYRGQILTMWRALRVMETPAKLRELREQMTVEAPE